MESSKTDVRSRVSQNELALLILTGLYMNFSSVDSISYKLIEDTIKLLVSSQFKKSDNPSYINFNSKMEHFIMKKILILIASLIVKFPAAAPVILIP